MMPDPDDQLADSDDMLAEMGLSPHVMREYRRQYVDDACARYRAAHPECPPTMSKQTIMALLEIERSRPRPK